MASLEQLMGQVVRAGNYDLQFYAQWAEEAETATLTTQQAIFWSQHGREQLLGGAGFGTTMGDILEEWDAQPCLAYAVKRQGQENAIEHLVRVTDHRLVILLLTHDSCKVTSYF